MAKGNWLLVGLIAVVIFSGQFLFVRDMATGKPPKLAEKTVTGEPVAKRIDQGPGIIYFWAQWCGLCTMMQEPVSRVLKDYPGVTVALKSGNTTTVKHYLSEHDLSWWPVVNDADGNIGNRYGIRGVPAVFVLNSAGEIVFSSTGYSTEIGLRFRLWLANFF
ncbi:MAG: thioredoxin domain-containing protein [Gammaproteobacteria bacterium]